MSQEPQFSSSVYGPVESWRFGRSLGIDPILVTSTCSFNCVYCQLGAIQNVTDQRGEFVSLEQLRRDLEPVDWAQVDVVTFSGSGEPTLATNLEAMVELIRQRTKVPIHLLSNSTQFYLPQVRREVMGFDVIACKLDAVNQQALERINRPAPGVTIERIVEGIVALKQEFGGRLTLQIMFMPMNVKEVYDWVPLINKIQPAEVQLNTPRRPYPLQ